MTGPAARSVIDPLHPLVSRHAPHIDHHPISLVATSYDVRIDGGFAVVETRRVFRNAEDRSIEATLTFPLPVQAVLFWLEAEHDGHTLKAAARKRTEAREVYEGAVEEGKTVVLHEELLRGIHMLSVAHVAPGAEIAVTARWATTLTSIDACWQLRIPLTVGQVYGQSPLVDSDALETGGAGGTAEVVVHCASGFARLDGTALAEGRARVPLNAPIDIQVTGPVNRPLRGVGTDGRNVTLTIAPLPEGRAGLDLAILVDRSGSMAEVAAAGHGRISKHEAVIAGLTALASRFRKGDVVDLWEFDDQPAHVGSTRDERPHWRTVRQHWTPGETFIQLARCLRGPGGGTEIGGALEHVLQTTSARDLLLITDGKSYALDVQRLAGRGKRIAVVLVGEDSLEANVGHLAAVTGGSVFVASGANIASAVAAAAESLRSCPLEAHPIEAQPENIEVVRGGAVVRATWSASASITAGEVAAPGIVAFAAGLAIPRMGEAAAAAFAVRAGIASHLTSLVLVDEAAAVQEAVPAMRKVRLPAQRLGDGVMFALGADDSFAVESHLRAPIGRRSMKCYAALEPFVPTATVDWDAAPTQLLDGDLSSLDPSLADRLRKVANVTEVRLWAHELKVRPIVLVVAALAYANRDRSRTAERIARRVLGDTRPAWMEELKGYILSHV